MNRLGRAHGVALDARNLHQPANGVAGHAEIVLHGNLGSVLHLSVGASKGGSQATCGHGTGYAHFALAADFGAADGRILLVQDADSRRSQEETHQAFMIGPGNEAFIVHPR